MIRSRLASLVVAVTRTCGLHKSKRDVRIEVFVDAEGDFQSRAVVVERRK